jgi:hypothetical protein
MLTLWHAWQGAEKTFLEQLAADYQGAEIEVTSFATDDELLSALRTAANTGDAPNLYLGPSDWSDELREMGIADAYCRPNQCPQCEGPNPPPWCEYATGNFGSSLNTDFNVVGICRPGGGCEVCLGPDAPRWCERVQFEQGPELDIFQADFVDIFDDGVFPVGIPVRWAHNAVAHRPGWFAENQQQVPGSLDEALQLETNNPGAVYLDNDSVLDGDPIPFPALQDFIDAVVDDPSPQPSDAGILATGETAIQRLQAEVGPLFQPSLADYQPQPIVEGVYMNPATEQISQALDFAYLIADEETQVDLYEQTGRLPTHGEAWQMITENEDEPQPGEIVQNLVTFGQQSMLAFTGKQPDLTIPDDLVDIPPPPFGTDACGREAWEWYRENTAGENLSRPERSLYYTSALDMAARCRMYQPIEDDGFCAERASTVFASMFFDEHAMATGVQESQDAALARYNLCRLRWVFDQFGPEVGAGNLEHIIGGLTIQLTIPSQTFTDTTDVVIQDGADTEVMTDADTLVGSVFAINAYNAASQQPVTELTQSISITVEYDDDLPGNLDETRLALFRWDDAVGQWNEVPGSQWNPAQNTVSANLEHLTTFAVRETTGVPQQDNRIYLPLVVR